MIKSCVILGNGPNLKKADIDTTRYPIGVNRSPLILWTPIVCSCDLQSLGVTELQEMGINDPYHWVTPLSCKEEPPSWAFPSGPFALWYAVRVLKIEDVQLIGFGGVGHFYEGGPVDPDQDKHNPLLMRAVAKLHDEMKLSVVMPGCKCDPHCGGQNQGCANFEYPFKA